MSLACDDVGTGMPIVCLHGFGMDRSAMAAALEPVLGRQPGLRRIYLDLPGHGESPAGPPTSAAVLDEVSSFVSARLAGQPALLAGWSYGGYIAMAMARRQPASVAGLLLVSAPPRIAPVQDRDLPGEPAMPPADGWLAGVPQELRAHLTAALGNRTAQVAARVAEVLLASRSGDEKYQRRLRPGGYRLRDERSPGRYNGPVAIITGRQDRIAGYADQFRSLATYPLAGFTIVANAGHYVPFEQPGEFAALVTGWLGTCAVAR
jgi:pimeloyl-ACP methyl ester carboxylesterase